MKARRSPKAKQIASALLVALVVTTVLSLSILGYLTVVEQQNLLSARSQVWNMSIAVVEAGIEEGLQQLNSNGNSHGGGLGADGWSFDGTYYTRSRTLPDGNSYDVKINASDPNNPVISCRANVTAPTFVRKALPLCFATEGVTTPTSAPVSRAVVVRTSRGNLFTAGLVAKRNIDLNGNGVYTDSYDSTNPTKSTNGKYDSAKYSGDHGDIATNGGVTNSTVTLGNANVYGIVHTGPQCPVSLLPQGGVGPHGAQVSDITKAKNLGYILEDANFTFPDTTIPALSYLTPTAGTVMTWSNSISSSSTNSTVPPSTSPWGGVKTNLVSNTTVSSYPNPVPPGLTTNAITTTSSTYPNPPPTGLVTNANYTSGSSTLPTSPKPYNVSTNYTTAVTTTSTYPSPGTYIGGVTTNYSGASGNEKTYTYALITGRTYSYTTYTYTYPISYTYTYPNYSYTYNLYQTNTYYFTNTYDYVLEANKQYLANNLDGKVCIAGPNVLLVLPNGLTGNENFTFNQGANLMTYAGGTSVTVNGNQYVNPNAAPASFVLYCTPSVTKFTLNGNGQFTGVMVAPNAKIAMNGSGKGNDDFCGSLMVASCYMNGHFSFHYDESLSHMPSNGRYLISGWDEIDPKAF